MMAEDEDSVELEDDEGDCYSDLHSRWVKTTPEATKQLRDEGSLYIKVLNFKPCTRLYDHINELP